MPSVLPGRGAGLPVGRIRTVRVTTGPVSGTGEADVTATFATAFADTDYTVVPVVEIDESGESLRVRRVKSRLTTGCVVNVVNNAITSKTGTVHVIAIHD